MKKNELVVKHNSLIRSRYDYTLAELRLVIAIASMIEADDEDFREYVVPAKEYAELMGADKDNTYKAVKKLGDMLLSKPLHIPTAGGFAICNWFSWYEYKDGRIYCSFHPKLKPYMLQLKEQFTKYRLENILRFKSVYSIRMYELAKSWEARGGFEISVDDLRKMFGLEGKYKLYADLKRKIIERSLKEINSLSDIRISYKEKKIGRKVTDLIFTVKPNLPKQKNYLASERAFISYMRKNHANDVLYDGPTQTKKRVIFSISKDGLIYDQLTGKELTADKSKKIWSWLYEKAKKGELPVLRQTSIYDNQKK
ncbi:replication initiation protein [Hydrogenimonas sp.]